MDQLDKLPMPALFAFGAVLAVIFYVRYWGVVQGGRSDPAKNPAAASVAAVIVDATALNRHADEVRGMTHALKELGDVGESIARANQHLAQEMDHMREELRIHREVRRNRD